MLKRSSIKIPVGICLCKGETCGIKTPTPLTAKMSQQCYWNSRRKVKEPTVKKVTIQPAKKRVKIKAQRPEEKKVKNTLGRIKEEIRLEAIQNDEYFCKGCGRASKSLDCSHILAVGYRKDMELVKENMQLMDRTCHMIWETMNVEKMIKLMCFEENLEFIKHNDELMYNILSTKLESWRENQL